MTSLFNKIVDVAAAADGGSLLLVLERHDGQNESLWLDRSIKSHGTPAFDTVTSDRRTIAATDCLAIAAELELIGERASPDARSAVGRFVSALRKQGAPDTATVAVPAPRASPARD